MTVRSEQRWQRCCRSSGDGEAEAEGEAAVLWRPRPGATLATVPVHGPHAEPAGLGARVPGRPSGLPSGAARRPPAGRRGPPAGGAHRHGGAWAAETPERRRRRRQRTEAAARGVRRRAAAGRATTKTPAARSATSRSSRRPSHGDRLRRHELHAQPPQQPSPRRRGRQHMPRARPHDQHAGPDPPVPAAPLQQLLARRRCRLRRQLLIQFRADGHTQHPGAVEAGTGNAVATTAQQRDATRVAQGRTARATPVHIARLRDGAVLQPLRKQPGPAAGPATG